MKDTKEKVSRYQVTMPASIHQVALEAARQSGMSFSTYVRLLILRESGSSSIGQLKIQHTHPNQ